MAYSPQTWVNGSPSTPINAIRLGHIESGVQDVDQRLAVVESSSTLGNELVWNGTDYTPTALKANTSVPRTFKGPADPATVAGVVLNDRPWSDSWLATSQATGYGPSGVTIPPNTSSYSTPATATAGSVAAIQTILNASTGGDVIEYTGPAISGTAVTLNYVTGSENWTRNVLIRPPLGTRNSIGSGTGDNFTIRCGHVTVAGFNLKGIIRVQATTANEGSGSGYWRCVDVHQGNVFWGLTGATRSFLVECVAAQRIWNGNGDRVDIYAVSTWQQVQPVLDGCYFRAKIRGVDPTAIAATLRAAGTIVVANNVASTTQPGAWSATSMMVTLDSIGGGSAIVALRKNGTVIASVACPASGIDRGDYAFFSGLSFSGSAGDVLSVDVTGTSGNPQGLTVTLGAASVAHIDTVQYAVSGGATGFVNGGIVRNTVLEGSSNSAVQTGDGAFGDFLYDNSWVSRDNNYAVDFSYSGGAPIRLFAVYNTILGRFVLTARGPVTTAEAAARIPVYQYNTATGSPDSYTPDSTNTVQASLDVSLPKLANLALIWPECPFTGDPYTA